MPLVKVCLPVKIVQLDSSVHPKHPITRSISVRKVTIVQKVLKAEQRKNASLVRSTLTLVVIMKALVYHAQKDFIVRDLEILT